MRLYYRISDKSYEKTKLTGATKEVCLMNFVRAFSEVVFGGSIPPSTYWVPPVCVIADRCERKTNLMVMGSGLPFVATDLGNAGSLRFALEDALKYPDDELVYFCEDDYLHLPTAPKLLQEGIKRADYVTLYDHPDKYTPAYNLGEYSKVIRTASSHWRYTVSTCMTFGTLVGTLRKDKPVWDEFTSESHPHDHKIFTELGKLRRRLAVPIPGAACHTDLEVSTRLNRNLIEPWAIELMIGELESQIPDKLGSSVLTGKTGVERLLVLDSMR